MTPPHTDTEIEQVRGQCGATASRANDDGPIGTHLDADMDRDGLYGQSTLLNFQIAQLLADIRQAKEAGDKRATYAIEWANRSVSMLQDAFFPVADALRALEAYLRDTPHHNAPEAAAARKAIAKFDEAGS